MSADLMPFSYEGQQVRTVIENGEPMFVGADVARILGYSNGRDAIGRHVPSSHRGVSWIATPSGDQAMTTLDEAGLYRLIMRANTEEAERFQEWVTATVLPTIRRTGSYSVTPELSGPELLARAVLEAQQMLAAKDERIAELEPRAEVADRLLDASGDLSVADAAKALQRGGLEVGERRLFTVLHQRKWTYRGSDGRWRVYQSAIESGYMAALPQSHYHPRTGLLVIDAPQPRVKPKGIQRILLDHGIEVQEQLPA